MICKNISFYEIGSDLIQAPGEYPLALKEQNSSSNSMTNSMITLHFYFEYVVCIKPPVN